MVILLINLTAFTQTTSRDSIKCFTYEQVRKITKDIKKGQLCDSISQHQSLQISHFKDVLKKDNLIISENNKRLSELKKHLNTANTKVNLLKKVSFFGIPVAIGGGILIGLILNK